MLSPSIRNNLWDAITLLRNNSLQNYKKAKKWQWLPENELRELRQRRIKDLLRHAHGNVPYYNRILEDAGVITSSGEISLQHFDNIPILDKEHLRTNFDELKSKDLHKRNWYRNTSGGSTGEPVIFIQDQDYQSWKDAIKRLFNNWTGYSVGEPRVVLWGSEPDTFKETKNLKIQFGNWVQNTTTLNSFRMTTNDMYTYVDEINSKKPVQILAYAESIYELARFIERNELKVFSPNAIMSSAGTLHPHMRESIKQAFKAPVFDRYGSREVGDIACECSEHDGLHVSAMTHYIEILDDDGNEVEPGEPGEIVVTLLSNFAMPLIRYRIGDVAVPSRSNCDCGRSWPLIKEIKGRVSDTFITADGTRVHGEFFTHLFYNKSWVRKFQVVQEEYKTIHISIVPLTKSENCRETHSETLEEISSKIKEIMGRECSVEFTFKDEIPPTDSGKYRYTISKVAK